MISIPYPDKFKAICCNVTEVLLKNLIKVFDIFGYRLTKIRKELQSRYPF
jgi:hypothetical protein